MVERHIDIVLLQSRSPQKHQVRSVNDVLSGPGLKIRVIKLGQPLIRLTKLAVKLPPRFPFEQVIDAVDKVEHLNGSLVLRNPVRRVIFKWGAATKKEPV